MQVLRAWTMQHNLVPDSILLFSFSWYIPCFQKSNYSELNPITEPFRKQRARFQFSKTSLSPPSTNLLLTVPRRYFCCDSLMLHVVMSKYMSRVIWASEYRLPIPLNVLFCNLRRHLKFVMTFVMAFVKAFVI